MDQYQNNSSGGFVFIIFLLIIGLCVGGYLLWHKYYEIPDVIVEPTEQEKLQIQRYTMRLIAEDYKHNSLSVNYTLKQLFLTQQVGIIKNDVVEVFSNATYNVTYDLFGDNGEYYLGKVQCMDNEQNILIDDKCIVKLDKNADVIFTGTELDSNNIQLIIKVQDGLIRKPLICVGYSPYIYNLKIDNLEKVSVPIRLSNTFDRCFSIGNDISDISLYYTVSFEKSVSNGNFSFNLIDLGYDGNFEQSYEFDNEIPDKVIKIEI